MRVDVIQTKVNAIITAGLLDGEPYDEIKEYIELLESETAHLKSTEKKQNDYWKRVIEELAGILKSKESEIAALKDAPTVDAVAVVNGEWVRQGQAMHCSVCEKRPTYQAMTPHCPNCGAKMRGEQNS